MKAITLWFVSAAPACLVGVLLGQFGLTVFDLHFWAWIGGFAVLMLVRDCLTKGAK